MFTLIAVHNPILVHVWTETLAKAKGDFMIFDVFLHKMQTEIKRGIETARGGKVQSLTILADVSMAIKKSDVWIVKNISDKTLVAKHRFTNNEFSIPLTSLQRALRRIAYIKRMDVGSLLDYVVYKKFPGVRDFLEVAKGEKDAIFLDNWCRYVEERLGNFIIVRRFNIAAPGTSLLAFYSSIPSAPPGVAWSLRLPSEEAKVLALWFNSSLNLIQTIFNRKETGGAYSQIDEYTLRELQILNPEKLTRLEKESLVETFNKIKDVAFPSILEQLRGRFWARVEIDRAILKVLGFNETETNQLLDYLYPALTKEIQQLKTLMQG
jgi:hypothetical protein